MASLQELRKRLRSIQSTGQLAGAMRTAATAKYAKLGHVREEFGPYAEGCRELLRLVGGAAEERRETPDPPRPCFIVLGANRGMCGGFNAELARFLDAELAAAGAGAFVLVCGRKAAQHLRERGIDCEEFPVSDVPRYDELRPVADRARALYRDGAAGEVLVLYQRFRNMLTQVPSRRRLLPAEETASGAEDGLLCLPDRASLAAQLAGQCFGAALYDLALECAAGAQAATMMAMRSACDNAADAAADLQITINRRRQADVTASVIETASGSLQQGV